MTRSGVFYAVSLKYCCAAGLAGLLVCLVYWSTGLRRGGWSDWSSGLRRGGWSSGLTGLRRGSVVRSLRLTFMRSIQGMDEISRTDSKIQGFKDSKILDSGDNSAARTELISCSGKKFRVRRIANPRE